MASNGNESDNSFTVMLLGKTGAGKSLLGNRLLGLDDERNFFFKVAPSTGPSPRETIASNFTRRFIANEEVFLRVLDTPGFFEDDEKISHRWLDVMKAFDLVDGVINALIIVISIRDLSPGIEVMRNIMNHFQNHTSNGVVVFTNCKEGTYTEGSVLSQFNRKYHYGAAGISFVFSDLRGETKSLQDSISEIYAHLKRIRNKTSLFQREFQDFFAQNLLVTLKSRDIRKEDITIEGLKSLTQLEISLVVRYIKYDVLQDILQMARCYKEKNENKSSRCSVT